MDPITNYRLSKIIQQEIEAEFEHSLASNFFQTESWYNRISFPFQRLFFDPLFKNRRHMKPEQFSLCNSGCLRK
jgi:hypothetical protein